MLKLLFRRIAIEISFFKSKKSSLYTIDPEMRNLGKKYEDIDRYLDFLASARDKLSIPSPITISLCRNIKFGYHTKNIRRKLFNPLAFYSGNGLLKTDILLYDYNYGGYPAKAEFHLYENKLFYIECNLGDIAFDERQELLQEMKDHFNIKEMDTEIHKLSDPDGHILSVENGADFKILFADTGNAFYAELSNIEIFYNKKQISNTEKKTGHQTNSQREDFSEVKNTG
jgi:hypothetical protein